MDPTTQFNIRISQTLLSDLRLISQHLQINRNEWLKFKIAELVRDEKQRIMEEIEKNFVHGRLDDREYERKMGFKPTPHLKKVRDGNQ